MELQKQSVFVETDKNYVTLLLSWIYYYLSSVLDVMGRRLQYDVEVIHSV